VSVGESPPGSALARLPPAAARGLFGGDVMPAQ
jgi:hypothetical protein